MNIVVGIQARLGSSRWPRKVLHQMPNRKTMIENVYERANSVGLDTYVLIPNNEPELSEFLEDKDIPFFEGHPENVLQRYCAFLRSHDWADYVIRITGDCPWIPVMEICAARAAVRSHRGFNIYSNVAPIRRAPDGWDVEVIKATTLRAELDRALAENDTEALEHVTSGIYKREPIGLFSTTAPEQRIGVVWEKCSVDTRKDMDRWALGTAI